MITSVDQTKLANDTPIIIADISREACVDEHTNPNDLYDQLEFGPISL